MYIINISHYTGPRCVQLILIVRGSFAIIQEAAPSYDSETGWTEITNIRVAVLTRWFSFVDLSEGV